VEIKRGRGYVYRLEYHIIWCVKYRYNVLEGEIAERLKVLISDLGKQHGFGIESLEVMPDHVHVLVSATPQHFIPDMVKALKGATGRRILLEFPVLKKRLWGRASPEGADLPKNGHLWSPSYFVATVSEVTREMVQRYIETQKERGGDSSGTETESV
jgi:putative transposase